MGQNLWKLLIGYQLHRKTVEPTFPTPLTSLGTTTSREADAGSGDLAKPKAMLGHWSHGTTHTFLGGADGTEFVRNFKLLSPTKLADRLKKRLSTEVPMLEWEKIDGDEARWEDEIEEGVLVGPRSNGVAPVPADPFGLESVMSVQPAGSSPSQGSTGWTKLKGR